MSINSNRKGGRGEREARDQAREHWHAPEECVRTCQVSGKFVGDVVNALPGVHVEVKFLRGIAALRFYDQSVRDAPDGETPIVMMRENRGKWMTMFRVSDTDAFVRAYITQVYGIELPPKPTKET